MIEIRIDPAWQATFPGARVGFIEARELPLLASHPALEEARTQLEAELRSAYGGMERQALRSLPIMQAFEAHFKPRGRTYHVLQQLESVASKGRSIPSRLCAVTALFMAELRTGLVAAGHDLDRLEPPLRLAPSLGDERYTGLGGSGIAVPAGDMMLEHPGGILSTVLHGPDQRTPITPGTRAALYTIYQPGGTPLGALEAQMRDLEAFIRLFAPEAKIERAILPPVSENDQQPFQ